MSVKQERLCRLCLNEPKNEFEEINEMKQIFDILLVNLDLDMIRDPIICRDCVEVTKRCLRFKLKCIDTAKAILLFFTGTENAIHDVEIIYKDRKDVDGLINGDVNTCRFCMMQLEANSIASVNTLMKNTVLEMLTVFIPEMDFNIIDKPIICRTCKEDIVGYLRFVLNIVIIEEKIKLFQRDKKTDNIGKVMIGNIGPFLFNDILEHDNKCFQIYDIKEEPNTSENTESVYPETYYSGSVKLEELDVKEDEINFGASTSDANKYMPSTCKTKKQSVMHKCSLCAYETKRKDLLSRHILGHKDPSEMKMYKCSLCAFEAKQKYYVSRHMLVHKDVSEIEMYKCSFCAFETKRTRSLKEHMLVHKSGSEIKMFKCSLCSYEAKKKHYINTHMVVHKDTLELKTYKCSLCTFEATQKYCLSRHMLVHKDVSEIEMYKCSLCAFEAKRKHNLTQHMSVHKDVSKIILYKCTLCDYKAKQKRYLDSHMLIHKDFSGRKKFKCSSCAYITKRKNQLTTHMLTHKDVSELKMYKCSLCNYEAKRKDRLTAHMLIHKNVSEIKMHRCSLCNHEAKTKWNLNRHMLVHKSSILK